jgi:hypothetical protein
MIYKSLLSAIVNGKGSKEDSILQEEIIARLKEAAMDGRIFKTRHGENR